MTALSWDQIGEHFYETGVDKGVLFPYGDSGYDVGVPWNGLISVTETPSGAEANATYADNIKYLNLISLEQFGGTIEAYTYPDEFAECDGSSSPVDGVKVGQQQRKLFGLCYRTRIGNDVDGDSLGYKLHIVWGALAAPSERQYGTVNESPEALTFSWTFSTTPVAFEVNDDLRPTSFITIDSTKVDAGDLSDLEDLLYGTVGDDPTFPTPDEVIALFDGSTPTEATPTEPSFVSATGVITIPTVTGIEYYRADTGAVVTGTVTVTPAGATLMIRARPVDSTYVIPDMVDDDWSFTRDP